MRNMISGKIKNQLLILTVPLIIANILQQLYNTIDALIIGRYVGSTAFAAIGVGGTIMNLFIFMIMGSCTGISIILAQLYGANNLKKFRLQHFNAILFGGSFTILISIIGIVSMKWILNILQTPETVSVFTSEYLKIIFLGLIVTFIYNLLSSVLRSIGNTTAALLFLAFAIVINFILDIVFIVFMEFGIEGAAWATVLSQFFSVVLCYTYMKIKTPRLLVTKKDMVIEKSLLKKTCNYSLVTAMHQSNLYIGKLLVQGSVNSMGTDLISAYTATSRIEGFANSFGDSGGTAMSVFIAQNIGSQKEERAKNGFITGFIMLFILGCFSSIIMYFTASKTIEFMICSYEGYAFSQGVSYLKIISVFYVLCFTGNAWVAYFEGNGKMVVPIVGATMHISLRVILSYMFIKKLGLNAVAVATGLGWFLVNLLWGMIWKYDKRNKKSCSKIKRM